ncbi:hypothetical protein GCM10007940_38000 [Portibacter lacus]|uniref:Uncharacterized protein n=1 Tax=Portibacter lacus TaxID=1099794 RepID=A0AA37WHA6_9BACT|nr:hypothetical protein GCM10007940_38000 [Portibacter lacus]
MLISCTSVFSQSATGTDSSSKVPVTFLISEDDNAYGELVGNTTTSLLDVCDDAMDVAYKKWIYMLADMEEEAEAIGFDIKGLKIWINFFWNSDGSIDHIVYYPKPNSKNIEYKDFTKFLDHFAETYVLDVKAESSFAHYGSASFPTFVAQMFPERNKE